MSRVIRRFTAVFSFIVICVMLWFMAAARCSATRTLARSGRIQKLAQQAGADTRARSVVGANPVTIDSLEIALPVGTPVLHSTADTHPWFATGVVPSAIWQFESVSVHMAPLARSQVDYEVIELVFGETAARWLHAARRSAHSTSSSFVLPGFDEPGAFIATDPSLNVQLIVWSTSPYSLRLWKDLADDHPHSKAAIFKAISTGRLKRVSTGRPAN